MYEHHLSLTTFIALYNITSIIWKHKGVEIQFKNNLFTFPTKAGFLQGIENH